MLDIRLNTLIDNSCQNKLNSQEPRDYLGASRLGVECERQLFFEFNNLPKDKGKDFTGRTARIFERGHAMEDMVANWLREANFEISTIDDATEDQYRFKHPTYPISGGCDGIITYSPVAEVKADCLWENKAVGAKSFDWIKNKNNLKYSKFEYYVQMQIYMKEFNLTKYPGLFSCINANTMEIYFELIKYNEAIAKEAIDKGIRIVTATFFEELPKAQNAPNCFACDWCSYKETCCP